MRYRIRITYKGKHYDEYVDAASAEDAKNKFLKGGKEVSNKILDYFGAKKKIDCEFSIDPVNELN